MIERSSSIEAHTGVRPESSTRNVRLFENGVKATQSANSSRVIFRSEGSNPCRAEDDAHALSNLSRTRPIRPGSNPGAPPMGKPSPLSMLGRSSDYIDNTVTRICRTPMKIGCPESDDIVTAPHGLPNRCLTVNTGRSVTAATPHSHLREEIPDTSLNWGLSDEEDAGPGRMPDDQRVFTQVGKIIDRCHSTFDPERFLYRIGKATLLDAPGFSGLCDFHQLSVIGKLQNFTITVEDQVNKYRMQVMMLSWDKYRFDVLDDPATRPNTLIMVQIAEFAFEDLHVNIVDDWGRHWNGGGYGYFVVTGKLNGGKPRKKGKRFVSSAVIHAGQGGKSKNNNRSGVLQIHPSQQQTLSPDVQDDDSDDDDNPLKNDPMYFRNFLNSSGSSLSSAVASFEVLYGEPTKAGWTLNDTLCYEDQIHAGFANKHEALQFLAGCGPLKSHPSQLSLVPTVNQPKPPPVVQSTPSPIVANNPVAPKQSVVAKAIPQKAQNPPKSTPPPKNNAAGKTAATGGNGNATPHPSSSSPPPNTPNNGGSGGGGGSGGSGGGPQNGNQPQPTAAAAPVQPQFGTPNPLTSLIHRMPLFASMVMTGSGKDEKPDLGDELTYNAVVLSNWMKTLPDRKLGRVGTWDKFDINKPWFLFDANSFGLCGPACISVVVHKPLSQLDLALHHLAECATTPTYQARVAYGRNMLLYNARIGAANPPAAGSASPPPQQPPTKPPVPPNNKGKSGGKHKGGMAKLSKTYGVLTTTDSDSDDDTTPSLAGGPRKKTSQSFNLPSINMTSGLGKSFGRLFAQKYHTVPSGDPGIQLPSVSVLPKPGSSPHFAAAQSPATSVSGPTQTVPVVSAASQASAVATKPPSITPTSPPTNPPTNPPKTSSTSKTSAPTPSTGSGVNPMPVIGNVDFTTPMKDLLPLDATIGASNFLVWYAGQVGLNIIFMYSPVGNGVPAPVFDKKNVYQDVYEHNPQWPWVVLVNLGNNHYQLCVPNFQTPNGIKLPKFKHWEVVDEDKADRINALYNINKDTRPEWEPDRSFITKACIRFGKWCGFTRKVLFKVDERTILYAKDDSDRRPIENRREVIEFQDHIVEDHVLTRGKWSNPYVQGVVEINNKLWGYVMPIYDHQRIVYSMNTFSNTHDEMEQLIALRSLVGKSAAGLNKRGYNTDVSIQGIRINAFEYSDFCSSALKHGTMPRLDTEFFGLQIKDADPSTLIAEKVDEMATPKVLTGGRTVMINNCENKFLGTICLDKAGEIKPKVVGVMPISGFWSTGPHGLTLSTSYIPTTNPLTAFFAAARSTTGPPAEMDPSTVQTMVDKSKILADHLMDQIDFSHLKEHAKSKWTDDDIVAEYVRQYRGKIGEKQITQNCLDYYNYKLSNRKPSNKFSKPSFFVKMENSAKVKNGKIMCKPRAIMTMSLLQTFESIYVHRLLHEWNLGPVSQWQVKGLHISEIIKKVQLMLDRHASSTDYSSFEASITQIIRQMENYVMLGLCRRAGFVDLPSRLESLINDKRVLERPGLKFEIHSRCSGHPWTSVANGIVAIFIYHFCAVENGFLALQKDVRGMHDSWFSQWITAHAGMYDGNVDLPVVAPFLISEGDDTLAPFGHMTEKLVRQVGFRYSEAKHTVYGADGKFLCKNYERDLVYLNFVKVLISMFQVKCRTRLKYSKYMAILRNMALSVHHQSPGHPVLWAACARVEFFTRGYLPFKGMEKYVANWHGDEQFIGCKFPTMQVNEEMRNHVANGCKDWPGLNIAEQIAIEQQFLDFQHPVYVGSMLNHFEEMHVSQLAAKRSLNFERDNEPLQQSAIDYIELMAELTGRKVMGLCRALGRGPPSLFGNRVVSGVG